jgi:hypothetical protein
MTLGDILPPAAIRVVTAKLATAVALNTINTSGIRDGEERGCCGSRR